VRNTCTRGIYVQFKFSATGGKENSNNSVLVSCLEKLHYTVAYLVKVVY
jgi:hypothetical protein